MGSRIGSLIVLLALGGIVAVAVLLVLRFSGDSETAPPVMVVSLTDDQPVLINAPLAVEVRARSGEPISTFALFVEGAVVHQALALDNADQGIYNATLFWTPQTLGLANLRVVATDTAGIQTELAVRVDVTDDEERVAQAAAARQAQNAAAALDAGETDAQAEETGAAPTAPTQTQNGQNGQSSGAARGGLARIISPEDGALYYLDSNQRLDVTIETSGTGPLASVLFYVTPVLPDGSFGESLLAYSATPDVSETGGVFRGTAGNIDAWLVRPGAYDLQLVALTPEPNQQRYEALIRITVLGGAGGDQQEEDSAGEADSEEQAGDGDQAEAESAAPDLAILTVRQDEDGITVAVINSGDGPAERAAIELSLIRIEDASVLASTTATVTLAPDQRVSIPLEVRPDERTDAFVVLEAQSDADAGNNTFQLVLAESTAPDAGDDVLDDEPTDDGNDDEPDEPEPPPEDLADLRFLEARFTDDGYALLTVINEGAGPSGDFTIHITAEDGTLLEAISRGAAAQPLRSLDSEILAGSVPHRGPVVVILDPDNTTPESNEQNNRVQLQAAAE